MARKRKEPSSPGGEKHASEGANDVGGRRTRSASGARREERRIGASNAPSQLHNKIDVGKARLQHLEFGGQPAGTEVADGLADGRRSRHDTPSSVGALGSGAGQPNAVTGSQSWL